MPVLTRSFWMSNCGSSNIYATTEPMTIQLKYAARKVTGRVGLSSGNGIMCFHSLSRSPKIRVQGHLVTWKRQLVRRLEQQLKEKKGLSKPITS